MKRKNVFVVTRIFCLCLLALFLVGCSEGMAGGSYFQLDGAPKLSNPGFVRAETPIAMPDTSMAGQEVHEDNGRTGIIDTRFVSQGYVVASVTSAVEAKFQVKSGTQLYNYDFDNDGTPQVFPLVYGNGNYEFTIFLHLEASQYEYFYVVKTNVTLENEFSPFLLPNQIVNYTPNSSAINLARQLISNCSSDLEVVQQVYYWVQHNITYDTDKADLVQKVTGYRPDLEQVLQDKKGICYDYAALVAAMLRSNGIPCKLIKGYVNSEGKDLYHAWNMIWLKETGWVAVQMPSTPNEWERLDLTFAASGDPAMVEYIGDSSHYSDLYIH